MIVPKTRILIYVCLTILPVNIGILALPEYGYSFYGLLGCLLFLPLLDAALCVNYLNGIEFELPEVVRFSKGREAAIPVRIENQKAKISRLRIGFALPLEIQAVQNDLMIKLPQAETSSVVDWMCRPLQQGRYRIGKIYIETSSLFGCWARRKNMDVQCEIRVYPNLYGERQRLAALFLKQRIGIHTQRQLGKGRDFEQLREYLPGDSFEDIDWKATARRQFPVTRIYQIERSQRVYVIIDASRLSGRNAELFHSGHTKERRGKTFPPTILERYITAALIVGLIAERQGDRFGLLTFYDRVRNFIRASSGLAHYNVCRDSLFTLMPQEASPDFSETLTFIATKIRRRSLLIFLTHLDDPVIAENFINHIGMLSRKHVIMVNMIKPIGIKPMFTSQSVSTVNDIYRSMGWHLQWSRLREIEKKLKSRGIGFALLKNENICTDLVSQYLNIKRRQIL